MVFDLKKGRPSVIYGCRESDFSCLLRPNRLALTSQRAVHAHKRCNIYIYIYTTNDIVYHNTLYHNAMQYAIVQYDMT